MRSSESCGATARGSPLQPKPFQLLVYLAAHSHRLVSKRELRSALWPDVSVSEAALISAVRDLRRALREAGAPPGCIETRRGLGFRIAVEMRRPATPSEAASSHEGVDLIGRDAELERLRVCWTRALASNGGIALLSGEAGIGKTRLASAALEQARRAGAHTARATCWSAADAPPLWPWTQLLREAIASEDLAALQRQLHWRAPLLACILPEIAPDGSAGREPYALRTSAPLYEAVIHTLSKLTERAPLAIFVDDLHWADDGSLHLLRLLAEQVSRRRILFIGTYRDGEFGSEHPLADVLARLAGAPHVERVELAGLDRVGVEGLLSRTLATPPRAPRVTQILEVTRGNPLFVGELGRLLAQRDEGVEAGSLPIPQQIKDVLRVRLQPRSLACRRLLQLAAVLSGRLDLRIVRASRELDDAALIEAVAEAESARWLCPGAHPGEYTLTHPLVQAALHEDLSGAERLRLHRSIGRALEALAGEEVDRYADALAHHFAECAALEPGKAARYAELAGMHAFELAAGERAALHFERVLALVPPVDEHVERRARVMLRLAQSLSIADRRSPGRVSGLLADAFELARRIDSPVLVAQAACLLAWHVLMHGAAPWAPASLRAMLEEAQNLLPRLEKDDRAYVLAFSTAIESWTGDDPGRFADLARRAFAEASGAEPEVKGIALTLLGSSVCRPEDLELRAELRDQIETQARLSGKSDFEFASAYLGSALCLERGDLCGADAAFSRAKEYAGPVDLLNAVWASMRRTIDGELELAERHASEVRALLESASVPIASLAMPLLLTEVRLLQGRAAELIPAWTAASALLPPTSGVRCVLARVQARSQHAGQARAILAELTAEQRLRLVPNDLWIYGSCALAEVAVDLGDARAAELLYEQLRPYSARMAILGRFPMLFGGSVHRALGRLAATLGRSSEAEAWLVQALETHASIRARPWIALSNLDLVRFSGTRSRRVRSRWIDEALELARSLGLQAVAADALALRPLA